MTRAEAARQAITETAARERRRSGLAAEAAALMQNPDYLAEALEVAALMEGAAWFAVTFGALRFPGAADTARNTVAATRS